MKKATLLLLVVWGGCGDDGSAPPVAVATADGAVDSDGASADDAAEAGVNPDGAVGSPGCTANRVLASFGFTFTFSGDGCLPGRLCGILPNGPSLNGTSVDQATLAQVAYAGMIGADGTAADPATLKDGELIVGAGAAAVPIPGLIMQGSQLSPDGPRPVRLRIESVQKAGDLTAYDISYESTGLSDPSCDAGAGPDQIWRPLCTKLDDAQVAQRNGAVLVNAVWDYGAGKPGDGARAESATDFTVACLDNSAIAKCIQIGYVPWKPRPDAPDRLLVDHHAACVRAVRADFCNNGFPLTEAGTLIRLYDTLPVLAKRIDAKGEASWTPAGALCISQTRLGTLVGTQGTTKDFSVQDYIDRVCPGKFTATGRPPWGGACLATTVPDSEQVFTEIPEKIAAPAP